MSLFITMQQHQSYLYPSRGGKVVEESPPCPRKRKEDDALQVAPHCEAGDGGGKVQLNFHFTTFAPHITPSPHYSSPPPHCKRQHCWYPLSQAPLISVLLPVLLLWCKIRFNATSTSTYCTVHHYLLCATLGNCATVYIYIKCPLFTILNAAAAASVAAAAPDVF